MKSVQRQIKKRYNEAGVSGVIRSVGDHIGYNYIHPISTKLFRPIYVPPSVYFHSKINRKLNVMEENWDLLIILDTCRPEALRQVSDDYEFINEVTSRWSAGGTSPEWIYNTFTEEYYEEISKTAYITSNPYSDGVLKDKLSSTAVDQSFIDVISRYTSTKSVDSDALFEYTSLFQHSKENSNFPSPRAVTDHTINIARQDDPPRIIAHYMPPHQPYLSIWDEGNLTFVDEGRRHTWDAYVDNLRWGLSEVNILLNNVDRDNVVITADHGHHFRRFFKIRTGHHMGMVSPAVRQVPWVETDATNQETYNPDMEHYELEDKSETSIEETLEALGYI
jgi:hypothetical protein